MVVRSSFVGCPAPLAGEVLALAQSFPGLGVVAVRPSSRSFSSWVCVSSFASEGVAVAFARRAAGRFLGSGCGCVVRCVGRRWRVSVPCLSPAVVAVRPVGRPRFGRFRVAG